METIDAILVSILIFLLIFSIYRAWKGEDVVYEEDEDIRKYRMIIKEAEKDDKIYCTFCAASFDNMIDYNAHLQNEHHK